MEVTRQDAERLDRLIKEWWAHPEQELESSVGYKGSVNATTFMAIVQRLRDRGFQPMPQEDRLSIILPNTIRFSIFGLGDIQQYCRDDTLAGRTYVAVIKDKTGPEGQMDFGEYDVRVKARREIPLAEDDDRVKEVLRSWPTQKKAFRLLRRWSFMGAGVRFDLSMVRSTPQSAERRGFAWVRSFKDHDLFAESTVYEVEIELMRDRVESPADAMRRLIAGVGEVLRGVQKTQILIRKSVRDAVLASYKELTGTDRFRGVAPVTLRTANMKETVEADTPNIRTGYNVTEKADGQRVHGYCNPAGELFMIDMGMNVYRTGLMVERLANTLVDGEWITRTHDSKPTHQLLLFDIYYGREGENVTTLPFMDAANNGRHKRLEDWVATWNAGTGPSIVAGGVKAGNTLMVSLKTFLFGAAGDTSIFTAARRILEIPRAYKTDGLIFTPNADALPDKPGTTWFSQFKWKPAEDNTIDFMVVYEKDSDNLNADRITAGFNPETGDILRYKTMRLYVKSSSDPAYVDPRLTVLMGGELPGQREQRKGKSKPAIFNPIDFPDTLASTAYAAVEMDGETGDENVYTEAGEPIQNNCIVEMRYDISRKPGWRWIPARIRHDKTERLQRKTLANTMNADMVANDVWASIHDPVTQHMISTGAEEPLESEIEGLVESRAEFIGKKYYDPTASDENMVRVKGLRSFHNEWIKDTILLGTTLRGGRRAILDMSCGRAGDIHKWIHSDVRFVLGVDIAGENIRDPDGGAFRRYLNMMVKRGREAVPPMVFAIADSSKPLVDGSAGATTEEGDILRTVFGKFPPRGAIPAWVESPAVAGTLAKGVDVAACMFSLHYFFESDEKLSGFIQNLSDTVAVGGYFVGCCFDGEEVFKLLDGLQLDGVKQGMDGDVPLWTIRKRYSKGELTDTNDSLGLAIDVEFLSIGSAHTEYLVPFKLLVKKLKRVGLELLSDEEAQSIGLVQSSNMFEVSYKMAAKAGKKYPMSAAARDFSFLNRWFIFKRTGLAGPVEIDDATRAVLDAEAAAQVDALNAASAAAAAAATAVLPANAMAAATTKALQARTRKVLSAIPEEVLTAAREAAASPEVRVETRAAAIPAETGVAAPEVIAEPLAVTRRITVAPTEGGPGGPDEPAKPRTIPVAAASRMKKFVAGQVFNFFLQAPADDPLGIGDTGSRAWLATGSPFEIVDRMADPDTGAEKEVRYPTIEHYMAGMKFKLASNMPRLAETIFSRTGIIHTDMLGIRQQESAVGGRAISYERDQELLADEVKRIYEEMKPGALRRYKTTVDETRWAAMKDNLLRDALAQRYARDARFRKIVDAARDQGKYLLNYVASAGSELGGKFVKTRGQIDGENKVGVFIMEAAGFTFET